MNKSTLSAGALFTGITIVSLAGAGLIMKLAVIMRYRYIALLFLIGLVILIGSYFVEEGKK